MDQQYSMTLGRPLGISGIGDCPFPESLSTDPALLRLYECFDRLTVLGRQILSSAQLDNGKIDSLSDKLVELLDIMPDEQHFDKSWITNPPQDRDSPSNEGAVGMEQIIRER